MRVAASEPYLSGVVMGTIAAAGRTSGDRGQAHVLSLFRVDLR